MHCCISAGDGRWKGHTESAAQVAPHPNRHRESGKTYPILNPVLKSTLNSNPLPEHHCQPLTGSLGTHPSQYERAFTGRSVMHTFFCHRPGVSDVLIVAAEVRTEESR